MFFKKRQPTEIETIKIILDYLNEELHILCQNTDPVVQDNISIRIQQVHEMIVDQTQKLKQLQWNIETK